MQQVYSLIHAECKKYVSIFSQAFLQTILKNSILNLHILIYQSFNKETYQRKSLINLCVINLLWSSIFILFVYLTTRKGKKKKKSQRFLW